MDLALISILKPRVRPSVSEAIALYEEETLKKSSSKNRVIIEQSMYDIIDSILDKISTDSPVSVLSLKPVLLEAVIKTQSSNELIAGVLLKAFKIVSDYVKALPGNYSRFLNEFDQYKSLIINSIKDKEFFSKFSVFDILQAPVEYQYAESQSTILPKEVDEVTNQVYTLFSKNRYWEQYRLLDATGSYSPLSFNRVAGRIGETQSSIDILYKDAIVYNKNVYKLRPNIAVPSRAKFEEFQWEKFSSKRLNPLKTFRTTLDSSVENYYTGFLDSALDINSITSDSKIQEYSPPVLVDRDDLVSTFGGEGKAIFDAASELKVVADYVGAFEGSVIGSLEYISKFSEYMFAAVYGRNETETFNVEGPDSAFGSFDYLFQSPTSDEKIPGLNFLDGFVKLKSFIHSSSVNNAYLNASPTLSYNPIYEKYKNGLNDRYEAKTEKYSYKTSASVDLLVFSIESFFNKCLYTGDFIKACFSSLDSKGRLIGSEGLGNVEAQLKMLQKVFPPGAEIRTLNVGERAPGLTGGIKLFLESYFALYSTFIYTKLPATSLETLGFALTSVSDKLDSVIYSIRKLGIASFSYIPNIQFKYLQSDKSKAVSYLGSLGFSSVEIEKLITATNLKDLIEFFAPLSDSSDLKSFFKGFQLSQLIYELGGDMAIDAYLSFLYTTNGVEGLLNVLDIAQKNKSKATKIQISKYPKLIGLLISLTYAVNPSELVKFSKILNNNNLDLLESISYLTQSGQTNIINSKEDIKLLQPIIDQVIRGSYSSDLFLSPDLNYEQTNSSSAVALSKWTKIIGNNLGNITSSDFIFQLYDKSVGLTPAELSSILGGVSPTTPLGQMLDGVGGGKFTSFIKYANITGLGVKLGTYKNSGQLSNFKIANHTEYSLDVLALLDALDSVFGSLKIATSVFESSLDYSLKGETNSLLEALLFSQNKTISSLSNTLYSMSSDADNLDFIREAAGSSEILESPGIGNSRLSNRVPVINSISPEQYEVLFSKNSSIAPSDQNLSDSELTKNLINKFIKFSEQNKLINDVNAETPQVSPENLRASAIRGTTSRGYPLSDAYFWAPATEYEADFQGEQSSRPDSLPYKVGELVKQTKGPVGTIKTNTLGVSYISTNESPGSSSIAKISRKILPTFDPVSSCRRFGGVNCEEIYENVADRCVNLLSKSLYPEEYIRVPGLAPTSVAVDRPLGSFKEYKPNNAFVPTSSYMSPPKFLDLLGENFDSFGEKGEPIASKISPQQIKFTSGGGEVSEFNNTEFAIFEGADRSTEVNSETKCAYLKSPFEYQLCMNMLKCKRFNAPLNGEYFLSFCPPTTAGGRGK